MVDPVAPENWAGKTETESSSSNNRRTVVNMSPKSVTKRGHVRLLE